MITREELMLIKGRVGVLKPHHQRIRALSENAYRLLAHDMPLLIAALEPVLSGESADTVMVPADIADKLSKGETKVIGGVTFVEYKT